MFDYWTNRTPSERMQVSSIEGCFDQSSLQSIKVDSIKDKSQFSQSVLSLLFIKSV